MRRLLATRCPITYRLVHPRASLASAAGRCLQLGAYPARWDESGSKTLFIPRIWPDNGSDEGIQQLGDSEERHRSLSSSIVYREEASLSEPRSTHAHDRSFSWPFRRIKLHAPGLLTPGEFHLSLRDSRRPIPRLRSFNHSSSEYSQPQGPLYAEIKTEASSSIYYWLSRQNRCRCNLL